MFACQEVEVKMNIYLKLTFNHSPSSMPLIKPMHWKQKQVKTVMLNNFLVIWFRQTSMLIFFMRLKYYILLSEYFKYLDSSEEIFND